LARKRGGGGVGTVTVIETDWQLFSVNNKIMIFYLENSEVKLCHHRQQCPKVLAPIKIIIQNFINIHYYIN